MRHWLGFTASGFGILALLVAAETVSGQDEVKKPTIAEVEKLLLEGTNAFRKEQGLGPLKSDEKLTATARSFAEFMADTDKYGHEADGRKPSDRTEEKGYEHCVISENIAYQLSSEGFATRELAERLVEGWKNSPGHRKNMLDGDVLEAGMGVAHSEKTDRYYAVQLFGRPKSAAIEFQVVNEAGENLEYELDGEKFDLPERVTRTHGMCRSGTLTFPWRKKDGKPEPFHPARGDRFEVSKDGEMLVVNRKKAESQ